MKFLLTAVLITALHGVSAQIEYTYDATGNRVERKVVTLRPAGTGETTTATAGTSANPEDDAVELRFSQVELKLFPNPTAGAIEISATGEVALKGFVVTSATGGLVLSLDRPILPLTIDLSQQPSGVYFVTLYMDGETKDFKVIKQ